MLADQLDAWPEETKLDSGRTVLRLAKIPVHYLLNAKKPISDAFKPTAGDEEEGIKKNRQPLLSVWNVHGITLTNAKNNILREAKEGTKPTDYCGFVLLVSSIHNIEVDPRYIQVSVHADPDNRDGVIDGEAHCGIQGLYYPQKAPKAEKQRIKDIRAQLVDACEKHADEMPASTLVDAMSAIEELPRKLP